MERAEHDLKQLSNTWKNPELQAEKLILEEFSDEKAVYIALMTMKALDYLHSKNVYYGDMKP